MLNLTGTDLPHAAEPSSGVDMSSLPNQPRRLWETDKIFRCPLMGMCLTVPEQKQVLKKAGIPPKGKSLYEMHEILIGACENQNRLSRKIENLFIKKFDREAALLRDLDEAPFMRQWELAVQTGKYESVLWAAATRQVLSHKNRAHIFGTAHMDMHQTAQNAARLAQRLSAAEEQIATIQKLYREEVKRNKALTKENAVLSQKCAVLESQAHSLPHDKPFSPPADQGRQAAFPKEENADLRLQLNRLKNQLEQRERQLARVEEKSQDLTRKLAFQEENQEEFKEQARRMIKDFMALNQCDDSCPSFNLCQKRILLVGGITKMESLYRELVEKGGGIFEYHDGYIKGGTKDLESRLRRADVVLCPVNCNSHGACSMVKNLGKKHKKPVHMLSGSSLSSVSQAIFKTAT